MQLSVFQASASTTLAASVVSSSVAFPAQGSTLTVLITNNGATPVWVLSGGTSVIVTPVTGSPIQPGQTVAFPQGLYSTLAAITVSGTANLTIQSGTGVPTLVYGQVSILGSPGFSPATRTLVPLDVSLVTTGSTAVTALATGHATAGGFLITANSAGICVDQITTAGVVTGTPSSTTCVVANQVFNVVPSAHAVSVNSPSSSVAFAGEGYQ